MINKDFTKNYIDDTNKKSLLLASFSLLPQYVTDFVMIQRNDHHDADAWIISKIGINNNNNNNTHSNSSNFDDDNKYPGIYFPIQSFKSATYLIQFINNDILMKM